MNDPSACDIGCDEYGYPIRNEAVSDFWALEWTPEEIAAMRKRRLDPATYGRAPLISVSPAGLAAGTVPNTPPIPARALFCRGVKIGLR